MAFNPRGDGPGCGALVHQVLPELVGLGNDGVGKVRILGIAVESKLILRLAIGDLVDLRNAKGKRGNRPKIEFHPP